MARTTPDVPTHHQYGKISVQCHWHGDQGTDGENRGEGQSPIVTWMATVLRDGEWDMSIEDLAALLTIDGNTYLSASAATWNITRHTDTKVDEYYMRYASEMDSVQPKAIAKELQEYVVDKMYWSTVSGSPFYQVAQSWMKGYVFNKEFEVHYETVWLDK